MKTLDFPGAAVATVFGAGLSPFAPGTAGSIVSVAIFHFIGHPGGWVWIAAALILPVAYWGCSAGQRLWGEDPSRVVVDEFAGCWIACLASPAAWGITGLVAAFILFRFFDILKPWPVSLFDRMKNPAGILLDDIASGVLAALVLRIGVILHGII